MIHTRHGYTIGDYYGSLVSEVLSQGQLVAPRGKANRELRPVVIETQAWGALARAKVKYQLAYAEGMAWLCGWDDVAWLASFAPEIARFSDDGKRFHGAYGKRLEHALPRALAQLDADPESRQVVLNVWSNHLDGTPPSGGTKDYPCNTQVLLKLRSEACDDKGRTVHVPALHATVIVRSQDLVWGFPYDHHAWWVVLTTLANVLDVDVGRLTQVVDSLHVYEPSAGFYDADRVAKAAGAEAKGGLHLDWPRFKSLQQARRCLTAVRKRVTLGHELNLLVPEAVEEGLYEPLGELARYLEAGLSQVVEQPPIALPPRGDL